MRGEIQAQFYNEWVANQVGVIGVDERSTNKLPSFCDFFLGLKLKVLFLVPFGLEIMLKLFSYTSPVS